MCTRTIVGLFALVIVTGCQGDPPTGSTPPPPPQPPTGLEFTSVETQDYVSCGVTPTGVAYCWGRNEHGRLGNGSVDDDRDHNWPEAVAGGLLFSSVDPVSAVTCGLTTGGDAYCWGANGAGQLGIGTADTLDHPVPERVAFPGRFVSLSAGNIVCGLTAQGEAYCWGSNHGGELGIGAADRDAHPSPTLVGPGITWAQLSIGVWHSCGVATDGTAYCWGPTANQGGQMGNGQRGPSAAPVAVSGGPYSSVATGPIHSCGLLTTGGIECWGVNDYGAFGDGTTSHSDVPVPVAGGLTYRQLSAGTLTTCAVATSGVGYCWGSNGDGQLGRGSTNSGPNGDLVPVAGGITFRSISAGNGNTCGISTTDVAYCWGNNYRGMLGTGQTGPTSSPLRVAGQG